MNLSPKEEVELSKRMKKISVYSAHIMPLEMQKHELIINSILRKANISNKKLLTKTRKRKIVYVRHAITYYLRDLVLKGKLTWEEVAKLTGRTERSTVYNSLKRAEELILTNDSEFKKYLL